MNNPQERSDHGNPSPERASSLGKANRETLLFQGGRVWWWLQGTFLTLVLLAVWILWSHGLAARQANNSGHELAVLGSIGDFRLTNQFGAVLTRDSLQNQVWVADVFFSRCAGPCPLLSQKMARLQSQIPPEWPVKLVSLTSDPGFDLAEVLQRYARQFGGQPERWHFLTGSKEQLQNLIVGSLKLVSMENDAQPRPGEDLFIHSTKLVLIDKQGRIRQYFDGLEADNEKAIVEAVHALARAE